jgi:hypothetical protein
MSDTLSALGFALQGGGKVQSIDWAAWGTPTVNGPCSTWAANATCNANQTFVKAIVEEACVGRASCDVPLGRSGHSSLGDPCPAVVKTLAVKATCTAGKSYAPVDIATVYVGDSQVWDGKQLVGINPGIYSGADVGDGVKFQVTNGAFEFAAKPLSQA